MLPSLLEENSQELLFSCIFHSSVFCSCILCCLENILALLKVALHFFAQYHINDN